MSSRKIDVTIKLQGSFTRLYNANKPENISDERYVNAIVSTWLLEKDAKKRMRNTDKEEGEPPYPGDKNDWEDRQTKEVESK